VLLGDRVVALPGERIAVDGVIREGSTSVDESMLTGESLPVDRHPGEKVATGALNTTGRIVIETTAVAATRCCEDRSPGRGRTGRQGADPAAG